MQRALGAGSRLGSTTLATSARSTSTRRAALDRRGIDEPGPEPLGRLRAAGDAEAQALRGRRAGVARGDVAGEERVARADRRRPSRAARSGRGRASGSPSSSDRREAAVGRRHDRLARARARASRATAMTLVLVVVELVADELLGLEDVRRDDVRLGAHGVAQRLAVGVDDGRDAQLAQHRGSGRRRCRARRRAAGSRRRRRSPRRCARYSSLSRNSSISRSVTAGPRSLISVCSPVVGSSTAVFVRDSSRMRTKSLRIDSSVSSSTMRVPVGPPAKPVAITGGRAS